ncbi:hypothetical protein ACHWQZ_G019614 [Mnemiopsis leidyi]
MSDVDVKTNKKRGAVGRPKKVVKSPKKNSRLDSVCSKEDVEHVVKSYADATRTVQKNVVEEAAVAQSSKRVVESVVRQLDTDKVEWEKRKVYVVILNTPEPKKASVPEDKKKEHLKYCNSTLGIPAKHIKVCRRAGKIDESKPEYCRPLIIKLRMKNW